MTPTPRRYVPPLPTLVAFERAASTLSFKQAALDLSLTPSAISHQIRNLEVRLGVQLFRRQKGATELTAAGRAYYEAIRVALNGVETATRALLQERPDASADLRVSALPFFASTVMLPALGELERCGVMGRLHLDTTHDYADFESSEVDVAIRLGRERSAGLSAFPLLEIRALPVCAPAVAAALATPGDLRRQTLIHVERQPNAWRDWLEDVGEAGLTPERDLWVDSVPAALEAAELGLGVALAMHPLIQGRREFGRSLTAPFGLLSDRAVTFHMICRPERSEDRTISALRNWLVRAVARAIEHPASTADTA